MRITTLLLLISVLTVSAASYAQKLMHINQYSFDQLSRVNQAKEKASEPPLVPSEVQALGTRPDIVP